MCIIDRSVPRVFDTNSLDGIMKGVAAAQWGGPTSDIQSSLSESVALRTKFKENSLATLLEYGSDTFKTWEDVIEYFSRLGGQ